jgi:hypothetical protein
MGIFSKRKVISPLPPEPTPIATRIGRDRYKIDFQRAKPSPMITPNATPTQAPNFGEMTPYEKLTADTFDKYGVPRAVGFGMAAAEGGKRNTFNIGAPDGKAHLAPVWDELTAATKAAKLLSGEANTEFYGNKEKGKQQFKSAAELKASPSAMLKAIEDAGYAGDKKTWKVRSASTGGAGKIYNSWSDFIMDTQAWKKWKK